MSNNAVKDDVRHKQKIIEVSGACRITERCLCILHKYLVYSDYDIYLLRNRLKCNVTDFRMELVVPLPPKAESHEPRGYVWPTPTE